jgi:hypothetical protein
LPLRKPSFLAFSNIPHIRFHDLFATGGNMPFIRGRYHINPILGEALEAARDAEAALLALKQSGLQNGATTATGYDSNAQSGDDSGDQTSDDATARTSDAKGPVHRVEIEAAEMVPSHSGRGQRGYAMRLHRLPAPNRDAGSDFDDGSDSNANSYGSASHLPSRNASSSGSAESDTHIFSNADDLLDFLREELADDSASR